MRKIISITQVSVDGVMQSPGGPEEDTRNGFTLGGWAMNTGDTVLPQVIDELMAREFDMLLGRWTYDLFASYWPYQSNNIATAFNKATKHVITHRPTQLSWERSQPITGNVVEELKKLKASDGPELHIWGSSATLQALFAADIIDEYRLWVFPVVLGTGKRLFESGVPPRTLSLVASQATPAGILLNTYQPVPSKAY